MSQLMLTSLTAQTRALRGFVRGLTNRLVSDERGQDAIEYVGVLVIVAAVIGVLLVVVSKIEPGLESHVTQAIGNIFTGGGTKKGGG
jgi:Flp pilus assembly pilin Flp